MRVTGDGSAIFAKFYTLHPPLSFWGDCPVKHVLHVPHNAGEFPSEDNNSLTPWNSLLGHALNGVGLWELA